MRCSNVRLELLLALLCLAGVASCVYWFKSHSTPSTEAVRLRNALLVRGVEPRRYFEWTPDTVPAGFARDVATTEGVFSAQISVLGLAKMATDQEKMFAITAHLTERAQRTGAAMADLRGTYEIMRGGGGYCSDFVNVFLAFANEAGLFAREWGFSFDGFGGWGHAFVEVFDRDRQQWVFLDVFNNFHMVGPETGAPVSALTFREHLMTGKPPLVLTKTGTGRFGFRSKAEALAYYRAGMTQWYLWEGNAVLTYDAHPAVRLLAPVARSAEQLAALAVGVHPRFRIVSDPMNVSDVEALLQVRLKLLVVSLSMVVCVVVMGFALVRYVRCSRASSRLSLGQ